MNYQKIYEDLINKAKTKTYDGYVEVHHIIPRCVGGTDDIHNLVALSAREHFLAHWLLRKIHPDSSSLIYAFNMMCINRNVSSHLYKYAREYVSQLRTGKSWGNHTEETKRNMSLGRRGVKQGPRTEEAKEKMRRAKLGTVQAASTVNKRAEKVRKKVLRISGDTVVEYNSIKEAADELNFDPSCISKVCKGKRNTYKGYVWKHASSVVANTIE